MFLNILQITNKQKCLLSERAFCASQIKLAKGDFMFSKAYNTEFKIEYNNVDALNRYPQDLLAEYNQSIEEGLDVEKYKDLFEAVAALNPGEYKTKMSDVIFEMVMNADMQKDYK